MTANADHPLISAEFVCDGHNLSTPLRMGRPKDGQMMGSVGERLAELAGRVCYDSLGRGRNSEEFHQHILEVGHLSVYEHVVFTVRIGPKADAWLPGGEFDAHRLLANFINRPGVWVRMTPDDRYLYVTLNVRAALEWGHWTVGLTSVPRRALPWSSAIHAGIFRALVARMPALLPLIPTYTVMQQAADVEVQFGSAAYDLPKIEVKLTQPETDEEQWITLLLTGSRGFSHELVRHGDFTAISQRSTRYVDESESPWVEHPLVTLCRESRGDEVYGGWEEWGRQTEKIARNEYDHTVATLQAWLLDRGVDKFTARKQARGAARGYLGNALYTEVIFSASVAQWLRIIAQRASPGADAEIRRVAVLAFRALQTTSYGAAFSHLQVAPSPDGIGEVVVPA